MKKKIHIRRPKKFYPDSIFSSQKEYDEMVDELVIRIKSGQVARRNPQLDIDLTYQVFPAPSNKSIFIGYVQEISGIFAQADTEEEIYQDLLEATRVMMKYKLNKVLQLIRWQLRGFTIPRITEFNRLGMKVEDIEINLTKAKYETRYSRKMKSL